MKKSLVSTAMVLSLACAGAHAGTLDFLTGWKASDYYMGLLISNADVDEVSGNGQDMTMVNATLGYGIWESFSIEARFGAGSDQMDSVVQDPVANYAAGLLRYHYTWQNKLMAYVGVGAGVRTYSDDIAIAEGVQPGIALAMGVNLFGSAQTAVNFEYFRMSGEDGSSSVGLGFHHYFGKR